MNGYIVKHKHLGIGKVENAGHRRMTIRFIDGQVHEFGLTVVNDGTLSRAALGTGHRCSGPDGLCTISQILTKGTNETPNQYEITYDDDLRSTVTELEIVPISEPIWPDVFSRFVGLAHQNYHLFRSREKLAKTLNRMLKNGAGLTALLSSRIDIHAHQAFVAGVVLTDSVRRYILADEVGLGKTIEAGVIISDLLAQKPSARILVLCPSTLTQQWLCELYSKFGGHIFKLLDLHGNFNPKSLKKVICSTPHAAYDIADKLREVSWDMIVVDEVHQLLASTELYSFVQNLSKGRTPLLLLSAIPAQRREDDFLRLLALLEPERYGSTRFAENYEFKELYDAQTDIGRRLRRFVRRIDGLQTNDFSSGDVLSVAKKLLDLTTLKEDPQLNRMVDALEEESPTFEEDSLAILHYVADNYRINRRIIRNRRQRLLDAGQLQPIARKFNGLSYDPEPLEIDVLNSVDTILETLAGNGIPEDVLTPFTRLVQQSLVSPSSVLSFFEGFHEESPQRLNDQGNDYISMGYMFGYDDWDDYVTLVWQAAKPFISNDMLLRALNSAKAWYSSNTESLRVSKLLSFLTKTKDKKSDCKIIIFAGYPGVARELTETLDRLYGSVQVTSFLNELAPEAKETNARRFQTKPETWVLVSDESGGEGRNFQFADEIVHFDTPWYAARIEQRIGRLDRLGRDKYRADVISNVLFCANSKEEGVVRCYGKGLGVYTQSISGLEFALREVEVSIAETAINSGFDGMVDLVPELAKTAEMERTADESEAVLDEASFNLGGAEKYKSVSDSLRLGDELETSFVEFFKAISYPKSTKLYREPGFQEGIWRFFADDTRFGRLPDLEANAENLFGEFKGTFRREIGQMRPDLNFFSVGNSFFDSVISTMSGETTGRTFAIACVAAGISRWKGLEFTFTAVPNLEMISGNYGLVNRAKCLFTRPLFHVFYDMNGTRLEGEAARSVLRLRESLAPEKRNNHWWNLTDEKAHFILDAFGERDARLACSEMRKKAETVAREHIEEKFHDKLQTEAKLIKEQLRQLGLRSDVDATREATNLQVYAQSIANWSVELDSVGFISVNDIDLS